MSVDLHLGLVVRWCGLCSWTLTHERLADLADIEEVIRDHLLSHIPEYGSDIVAVARQVAAAAWPLDLLAGRRVRGE